MKRNPVFAAFFAIMMAVCLLSGCTPKTGVIYETLGVSPDAAVLTVDGNKISADYYAYLLSDFVSYLEYQNQTEIDWTQAAEDGTSIADEVGNQVFQQAIYCATLENLAKQYGIELDDEQKESVKADLKAVTNTAGLQRSTWKRALESQALESNLYAYFSKEDSELYIPDGELLSEEAEAGYITVEHILILTVDPQTGEALEDQAKAEKAALAEDIAAQIAASPEPAKRFEELAEQYSEDDRETYPSYTFVKDAGGDAFTETAVALEEGGISGLVETEYGYHIVMRVALDRATVCEQLRQEAFASFMNEAMGKAKVETEDVMEKMDIAALYTAVIAKAQEASADAGK